MSVDDNDNYYVLEEEEDLENSPKNFAAYADEERETEEQEITSGKTNPFLLLLQIMFNPVEGWKKLRRSKISVDNIQTGCFYPLLSFLAISKFTEFFYSVNVSLSKVVSEAVIAFVAYFFGFFCIRMILSWILPEDISKKTESVFGNDFFLISLSSQALFSILMDLFPMIGPILFFLPIWTLYIMFKGVRFFKLPQKYEMKFYVLSVISVIGVPLLIDWGLNAVLPY